MAPTATATAAQVRSVSRVLSCTQIHIAVSGMQGRAIHHDRLTTKYSRS
jgi:hypothetical protein